MKTHENRTLFSRALLKATTCTLNFPFPKKLFPLYSNE